MRNRAHNKRSKEFAKLESFFRYFEPILSRPPPFVHDVAQQETMPKVVQQEDRDITDAHLEAAASGSIPQDGHPLDYEEILPSTEIAPGVFIPIGQRFKSLNSYMTTMDQNREFQQPLQKLAKDDKMVLPCVPDDKEKYAYIKTNAYPLLAYLVFSLVALTIGMWLFIIANPAFYVFSIFSVYICCYLALSFYTGMIGPDFDLKGHNEIRDKFRADYVGKPSKDYPSIDIYLPTCKEPLYVLQNTYEHVIRMDWPNFNVWVLDDGAEENVKKLAFKYGFNYIVRPNRPHLKKAGNMRYAFGVTNSDYYMVLDADFCPRTEFLWEIVPRMIHDPTIGVCQTPQFFRIRKEQTWVEKGAGLTQELFYRVIQTKRNRLGGAICVGTSALYRRAALTPFGGSAEIEHSEDVFTGFMAISSGWTVQYVAICLSMGLCPENLQTFFNQQYRWASGSTHLLMNKDFWKADLKFGQRLCYLCGMLYYWASAVSQFVNVLPGLLLIWVRPDFVKWFNIFFAIPSILVSSVVLVFWTRHNYNLHILKVQVVQSYAALFAIKDRIFGTQQGWIPSGGKSTSTVRFAQARALLIVYTFLSFCLTISGSLYRTWQGYEWYGFLPTEILCVIQLAVSVQFMLNWD